MCGTGVTLREGGAGTRPSSLDRALAAGTVERTGCGTGGTDVVVPARGEVGSCGGNPESDGMGGAPFLPAGQVDVSSGARGSPSARWHSCLAQLASVWSGADPGSFRSVRLFWRVQTCQVLVTVPQTREVPRNALVKPRSDPGGPEETSWPADSPAPFP